jgi:hypothetical protein
MVTDPASAIHRQVYELIDSQIAMFSGPSLLTDADLLAYRGRAELIKRLYSEIEQIESRKVPKWHPGRGVSRLRNH